jgi:3-oxoacyl-[acyl-carrier protein] reductase
VTTNNLLPGPFDTNRLRNSKEITRHLTSTRLPDASATPTNSERRCALLCRRHAGYIIGQNLLMDGGLYPGSF